MVKHSTLQNVDSKTRLRICGDLKVFNPFAALYKDDNNVDNCHLLNPQSIRSYSNGMYAPFPNCDESKTLSSKQNGRVARSMSVQESRACFTVVRRMNVEDIHPDFAMPNGMTLGDLAIAQIEHANPNENSEQNTHRKRVRQNASDVEVGCPKNKKSRAGAKKQDVEPGGRKTESVGCSAETEPGNASFHESLAGIAQAKHGEGFNNERRGPSRKRTKVKERKDEEVRAIAGRVHSGDETGEPARFEEGLDDDSPTVFKEQMDYRKEQKRLHQSKYRKTAKTKTLQKSKSDLGHERGQHDQNTPLFRGSEQTFTDQSVKSLSKNENFEVALRKISFQDRVERVSKDLVPDPGPIREKDPSLDFEMSNAHCHEEKNPSKARTQNVEDQAGGVPVKRKRGRPAKIKVPVTIQISPLKKTEEPVSCPLSRETSQKGTGHFANAEDDARNNGMHSPVLESDAHNEFAGPATRAKGGTPTTILSEQQHDGAPCTRDCRVKKNERQISLSSFFKIVPSVSVE